MNRFFTKSIALIAMVGAFTLVPAAKSEAALQLFLCDVQFCAGGTVITVNDDGAGDLQNATEGVILWSGTFGGFTLSIDTAFGVPFVGTSTNPQLDLNFSASGAGDGWIYAQQGDFNQPNPPSFTVNFGGTTTGSATVEAIVGVFGDPWTIVGPFGGPFSGSFGVGNDSVPYFQAIGIHIVQGAGGLTTGDIHMIPEPLTLSLLGLGLAGFAARRRRR